MHAELAMIFNRSRISTASTVRPLVSLHFLRCKCLVFPNENNMIFGKARIAKNGSSKRNCDLCHVNYILL